MRSLILPLAYVVSCLTIAFLGILVQASIGAQVAEGAASVKDFPCCSQVSR